jgi:hypothetical protein
MPNFQCHLRSSFCATEMFSFSAAPTQAPQKFKKCYKSRTLFGGDCPRLPRSLSWKKFTALRRVWHKPECILEARAFFAFPETLAGKVANMSVACRCDSQMPAHLAEMPLSWQHKIDPTQYFRVGDCRHSPLFS